MVVVSTKSFILATVVGDLDADIKIYSGSISIYYSQIIKLNFNLYLALDT